VDVVIIKGGHVMAETLLNFPQKQNPLELFLNNLDSDGSRKIYRFELNRFFDLVQKSYEKIEALDILKYKAGLDHNKRSTRNRKLSIIKSYFRFLVEFGFIEENPAHFLKFKAVSTKEPDVLQANELRLFLSFPTIRHDARNTDTYKEWLPKRDQAMLALMGVEGLRVSEVCHLNVGDYIATDQKLAINGKGDKAATIRISTATDVYLQRYLKVRPGVRSSGSPLFIKSGRGCTSAKSRSGRVTVAAVQHLVKQVSELLDFGKHVTPHVLRHTAATLMLENGASIKKVSRHLRHSSIQTTSRYLHILDNKQSASEIIFGGV
jgi:site-specific recombinase XerD